MNALLPARASAIRVVVIEDSVVQRAFVVGVLEAEGDIVVVGEAASAVDAIAIVGELLPDVVTLDLEIPGGGQHALEQIMAATPTPVVVLSGTLVSQTSAPAIEALVTGAMIAMPKPPKWTPAIENDLRRNVRTLRSVPVVRHVRGRLRPSRPTARTATSGRAGPQTAGAGPEAAGRAGPAAAVVAIAASTGGPQALATVLGGLGGLAAPVMVVQHLHADFVGGLVDWMARVSPLPVVLAVHGRQLRDGYVHIAPGGTHLRIGPGRRIELGDRPTTVHQPSANELFASVARHVGELAVGVLLTGMGEDGASGLAEMHERGASTIAQDEASCAVYGMPRAAVRLGVVDQLLALPSIAAAIVRAERVQRVRR